MATYDPDVLEEYADRLESRANFKVVAGIVIGLGLGVLTPYLLAAFFAIVLREPLGDTGPGLLWAALIAGPIVGALIGNGRGFLLRVQAQTILCRLQIERNTRPLQTKNEASESGESEQRGTGPSWHPSRSTSATGPTGTLPGV